MVRIFEDRLPVSSALPTGGPTSNAGATQGKTVDKPTSSFDRRRHHIVRKEKEPSKIFIPLDPNEQPKQAPRGKGLHTDPFGSDRDFVEFRRAKHKVQTPRGPARPERRIVKSAPAPVGQTKPGVILSTGVQHLSPKRVPKEKHQTTHEKEQPPKSFLGNRRFLASPDKQQSVRSPCRSLGASADMSLGSPSRVVSQVFAAQTQAPLALAPAPEPHRKGIRMNPAHVGQGTLVGVWGPMPGGRAPKPSSLAPWLQESYAPHTGRKLALTARPAASNNAVPYAITDAA